VDSWNPQPPVWRRGAALLKEKDLGRCTGKQSNRREPRLSQNVWRITVDRIPVVRRWGDGGDEENGQRGGERFLCGDWGVEERGAVGGRKTK